MRRLSYPGLDNQALPYLKEAEPTPSTVAELARMERMKEAAATDVVGCTIDGGQETKTEILVNMDGKHPPPVNSAGGTGPSIKLVRVE